MNEEIGIKNLSLWICLWFDQLDIQRQGNHIFHFTGPLKGVRIELFPPLNGKGRLDYNNPIFLLWVLIVNYNKTHKLDKIPISLLHTPAEDWSEEVMIQLDRLQNNGVKFAKWLSWLSLSTKEKTCECCVSTSHFSIKYNCPFCFGKGHISERDLILISKVKDLAIKEIYIIVLETSDKTRKQLDIVQEKE